MTTTMTARKVTAEWQCTRCDTTNRKLVPEGTREIADKCVACHLRHAVAPGTRPVRWNARAA